MEYADSIWAGANAIDLNCLDMVQKYAANDSGAWLDLVFHT